ncbi:uncharacterized protein BX663DRAFT_431376 [Cokeromyces recurvatus]|uniref:uncharacterized protein n=1 Tax=Cokeromyces recurvatus TaxID=90255 RepID=UPI002220F4BC|nr:uncharacterized protein BX663DRAFT_431376 [Cokeromyces recurvatus]KAI7904539.1 hypothetical protein BX663DRAFT_431376 [Cokeromyces recurvatus]
MAKDRNNNNKILKKILEVGHKCCISQNAVRDLLGDQTINEKDVGEILGSMARSCINMSGVESNNNEETWNVENFVTVIKEKSPSLDWVKAFKHLDYPHFFLFDGKGLNILIKAWNASSDDDNTNQFPINVFFCEWNNLRGKLTALYQIAVAPPNLINLYSCSKRTVIQSDDFTHSPANVCSMAQRLLSDPLNSLDLIEHIIMLADSPIADDVKALLERVLIKKAPELLFMGLFQIDPIINSTQDEILKRLMNIYLTGNASSLLVFTKLWKVKPELFKKSIIELHEKEPAALSRILVFIQELKILPFILEIQPFLFTIDLAALATRRELLNLERWLQDKINKYDDIFIQTCLRFLGNKARAELSRCENKPIPITVSLSRDVVTIFVKVLSERDSLTDKDKKLLNDVHMIYNQLTRKQLASSSNEQLIVDKTYSKTTNTTLFIKKGITFNSNIEDEAYAYYQQLYSGDMSVSEMIDKLNQFCISNDLRDRNVFACIIYNLFDEYRFFYKYPDRELTLTSVLFGSLIQNRLLSHEFLDIALNGILESLKNPPTSKLYHFGIHAITQFEARLAEWPNFCEQILQIPSIQQTDPKLALVVRVFLQMEKQKQRERLDGPRITHPQSDRFLTPTSNNAYDGSFNAIHIPDIPKDDTIIYESPDEIIQGKILFILNNVASNNFETKVAEMKEYLRETLYQWFSHYLVVKRVSVELNYHSLYLDLLKALNSPLLDRHIMCDTLVNIHFLLNSDNTLTSSSDRSLLKNLGAWLGGMTLARNKPITQKYIQFKELLLEGYYNKRLIVVIPFVCKILEQGKRNTVFVPPNPWLMAILKLLVELYRDADLKLNLKFEIEVLCKNLSIELDSIEPSMFLKMRLPLANTILPNMDYYYNTPLEHTYSNVNTTTEFFPIVDHSSMIPDIPDLGPSFSFNSIVTTTTTAPYMSDPAIQSWVQQAVSQATREVILWYGDRSIKQAVSSTYSLITKDLIFLNSDESSTTKSAQTMIQNLVRSLIKENCKEPLRLAMINHLYPIFITNRFNTDMARRAALSITTDNLELAYTAIEQLALKKATEKLDKVLMVAYTDRKRFKEQNQTMQQPPYFDSTLSSNSQYYYFQMLPEFLCPQPNYGIQPPAIASHHNVYEDFGHLATNTHTSGQALKQHHYNIQQNGSYVVMQQQQQQQQIVYTNSANQIIIDQFTQCIHDLESLFSITSHIPSFNLLPPQHEIMVYVKQIPLIAMSSFDKTEMIKVFAQRIVQLAYANPTQLGKETYLFILERLCHISPNIRTLVSTWISG